MQRVYMDKHRDSEEKSEQNSIESNESKKDPRSPVITRSRSKVHLLDKEVREVLEKNLVTSKCGDSVKRKHQKGAEHVSVIKKAKGTVNKSPVLVLRRNKLVGKESVMSAQKSEFDEDSLGYAMPTHSESESSAHIENEISNVCSQSTSVQNESETHDKMDDEKWMSANRDAKQPVVYTRLPLDENKFMVVIDDLDDLYSMPCADSNNSSFASYSHLAQADSPPCHMTPFAMNDNQIKIDENIQNINLLPSNDGPSKIISDNCEGMSFLQPSLNVLHADGNLENLPDSKSNAAAGNENKFVNVIQFSTSDKAANNSPSPRVTVKPKSEAATKFVEVIKYASEDKPSTSSTPSSGSKIKYESESDSRLVQLIKLRNKYRAHSSHCLKSSSLNSQPTQMETSCDTAVGGNDTSNTEEDFISVPLESDVNSILEDSAVASSSHGNSAASASAARSGESRDSDLGRLQALLEARGIPVHVFGALGHHMQHLFQRSMGSSSSSNRAHQLLQGLQAVDDEGRQLLAVREMCQLLVMGNEDTLTGFPVKQVVPVLINLLSMEHNFEMMNNSCRALTYLMEALPRSSSVVVQAVPAFLNKLQFIQCMDVAEQSLTALEMLSRWHSKAILHARGISICLTYFDFFSINAQRAALAITANCCQNLLPDEFGLVQDSLSLLSGLLSNQDEKSVESVCLAFSRLVDCFQYDAKCLKEIVNHSLLSNIQQLLIVTPSLISTQTFTTVIRMLALMCASCSELAVLLLNQNISDTLCYLLTGNSDGPDDIKLSPRNHPELFEISHLIYELMPRLPHDGIFSIDSLIVKRKIRKPSVTWKWKDDSGSWRHYSAADSRIIESAYQSGEDSVSLTEEGKSLTCTIDLNAMQQINGQSGVKRPLQRCISSAFDLSANPDNVNESTNAKIDSFDSNFDLIIACIKTLFPVLYEIYCSSAGPSVRYNCLRAMLRMMYFAPPDVLNLILEKQMISRHIAGMLASQDYRVVVSALQMADILIQKLPGVFGVFFIREGVMHEIKLLTEVDIKIRQKGMLLESSPSCSHLRATNNNLPSSSSLHFSRGSDYVSSLHISSIFENLPLSAMRNETCDSDSPLRKNDASSKKQVPKNSDSSSQKELPVSQDHSVCSRASEFYDKINTWIKEQAQKLHKLFGIEQLDYSHPAVNVLNQLTTAVNHLESICDNGLQALSNVCTVMTENDISSFELIHSGLIEKLHMYLTVPQGGQLPFGATALEDRLRAFLHTFMGCPSFLQPNFVPDSIDSSPLAILISKLNACVSQLEQFAVKVHDIPASSVASRRGTSIAKYLNSHQIKCNFQRYPGCSNLKQWRGGPVMIDPLASIHNIDRYLVSQGYAVIREEEDDDDDDEADDQSESDNSDEDLDNLPLSVRFNLPQGGHKLQFLIGKNVLPYNMTVYQAIRQYGSDGSRFEGQESGSDDLIGFPAIWARTHTIFYRPLPPDEVESTSTNETTVQTRAKSERRKRTVADISSHAKGEASEDSKLPKRKWDDAWHDSAVPETKSPLAFISNLPKSNAVQDPSLEVIYLLRVLHALSSHWGILYQLNSWESAVPQVLFINNKLTMKADRQIQDLLTVMTGNIPAWLSQISYDFPFLFPFQTRYLLFHIISFDRERALQRVLEAIPEARENERFTPKLDRKKRTVTRDSILKQAESVFQDVGNSKALLEIQYKNEVGTGLGPTLEFYFLVSKELQRADLEMWRGDKSLAKDTKGQSVDYMYSSTGLFPLPLSRNVKTSLLTKISNRFKLLGKLLAKALMDSRILDIPLSPVFYKWMLNQGQNLSLADLRHIDEDLAVSILKLEQLVIQKKKIECDKSLGSNDLKSALESLTLDGCPVEDLNLDFTLPGFSHVEMKKVGKDTAVSIYNLEEYLMLLKHWTMREGVWRQMKAFREGFESVFSLNQLQIFYPDELEQLFCGNKYNQWSTKVLMECCRVDHGYTYESRAIKYFFDILSNYDQHQQRRFLQFVTGSPRLPVGGLKSLNPPLTIVRTTIDSKNENPDSFLPSVMTCCNYVKLPDYSSIVIMQEKLGMALSEGQLSFHLS